MALIIEGTAKSDVLVGTNTSDTINAGAGNDVVSAGDGNDTVYGGDGNDRLYGGDGSDTLRGDDGNDRLYGDDGDDLLYGDSGNDWLWGGMGDDVLNGSTGNDALFGGDGNDVLNAGADDDRIDGGNGNDILRGEGGDDLLIAGEGDDFLDGGEGVDTVSYAKINGSVYVSLDMPDAAPTRKGIDVTQGSSSPLFGLDHLNNIENVIGSQFDDVIFGNHSANRLEGGEGNDFLCAVGDDTLVGGIGGDIFSFAPENTGGGFSEAWIEDFSAAEGDKINLIPLGTDRPELLSNPNLVTINELPGESIITVNADGVNFLVGVQVIHVMHSVLESPALQISDFYFT